MSEDKYKETVERLSEALKNLKPGQNAHNIKVSCAKVLERYQRIFTCTHIASLTSDEFISFLDPKNNCHWINLYRKGYEAATDMERLREALALLLDEGKPNFRDRFSKAIGMVRGFGKATATAILTVAYPDKYGVWNGTSEAALCRVGLWPNFERGDGIGGQYEKVNKLLERIRLDVKTDFWTLDALWWYFIDPDRLL